MDAQALVKNWKTTIAGIVVALVLLWPSAQAVLDDDPDTAIDWPTFTLACSLLGLGVVAKDGDKSSRDLGL